jgi:hypothetical protein
MNSTSAISTHIVLPCRNETADPISAISSWSDEPRLRAGVSLCGERPLLAYAVEKLGFPLRALFRPQSIESDNRQ